MKIKELQRRKRSDRKWWEPAAPKKIGRLAQLNKFFKTRRFKSELLAICEKSNEEVNREIFSPAR